MNSKILTPLHLENLVESKVESQPVTPSEQPLRRMEKRAVVPRKLGSKNHFDYSDFAGKTVNRLTAVKKVHGPNDHNIYWEFLCSCGKVTTTMASSVISGSIKSCGCLRADAMKALAKHGMAKTKVYKTWAGMKSRCTNPNNARWADYGGRGIYLCDSWMDFEPFYQDMGEPPSKYHSLDRINVNGNYCPENCRWATSKEQSLNMRTNLRITINGDEKTVHEWASIYSMTHTCLRTRLRRGWEIVRAVSTPMKIKPSSNASGKSVQ